MLEDSDKYTGSHSREVVWLALGVAERMSLDEEAVGEVELTALLHDVGKMAIPKQIVLQYLPPPGENAQTCGPGPFSMANPEVVTAQLKAAGFEKAQFTRSDGAVMVGSSVEQAMDFQLALGPAGEIFREAGAQAERRRQEIENALRAELAHHLRDGKVYMQSSSWAVTARKPAA